MSLQAISSCLRPRSLALAASTLANLALFASLSHGFSPAAAPQPALSVVQLPSVTVLARRVPALASGSAAASVLRTAQSQSADCNCAESL